MRCLRCGNEDTTYFFKLKDKFICRKCITFIGKEATFHEISENDFQVQLKYPLSEKQLDISDRVLQAYIDNKNVLIHAICGAGKTELVFQTINYALNHGKQVGFAVPRKDVVIDLYPRFQEAFPVFKIIAVYGDHTDILEGDIILLTTHQLYRYNRYFDLLIIDETDAFPFYGDKVLEYFFKKAIRGTFIMLTATPLKRMKEIIQSTQGVYLTLFERYHHHPLPVPIIKRRPFILKPALYDEAKYFILKQLPLLIFVPTIEDCEDVYNFLKKFLSNGEYVHSKRNNREEIIQRFKEGKYDYLVTTSVLERGVTIKNLQVIIYKSEHNIYDKASLIQISGRVGRKIDAYDGKVIFLCQFITSEMEKAISEIKKYNQTLL